MQRGFLEQVLMFARNDTVGRHEAPLASVCIDGALTCPRPTDALNGPCGLRRRRGRGAQLLRNVGSGMEGPDGTAGWGDTQCVVRAQQKSGWVFRPNSGWHDKLKTKHTKYNKNQGPQIVITPEIPGTPASPPPGADVT